MILIDVQMSAGSHFIQRCACYHIEACREYAVAKLSNDKSRITLSISCTLRSELILRVDMMYRNPMS